MSNPGVFVRLEPEILERLREKAGESSQHSGRSGGVALYLRQLVYDHLGLPMPVQFGDRRPDLKDLYDRRRRKRAEKSKPARES